MNLRVLILSRVAGSYSTQRLKEVCVKRGHTARVLNTMNFSLLVEPGGPQLWYRDRQLSRYDAAIPRIGASVSAHGTAVVRQLEQMGVFTLNSARAIGTSRDKLRTLQILSRHDVGFPSTAFIRDRESVRDAIERVGGPPVIIKLTEGSQGAGVILADSSKAAEAVLETLLLARQNVLVQKFVSESSGNDLRALVVGGRVIAAMRRRAAPDEFRSNVHRGGRTERVRLDPEVERLAVQATQILGLRVAGVDLIESDEGPLVLEVNSSPGLEGIESATGVDVASEIVEHMEREMAFPELDLQQRLTLTPGHRAAELVVGPGSGFAGRTLIELELAARGIAVLSLVRGVAVHPNPGATWTLQAGDRLLCFGPHEALRVFVGGSG
ncbi:MAG TPA: RimK family alpha-L-glutamate ligase [Polyangiaceae bacterium]|jgi:ribosomal protein S6--L-glutamate ligase|nr:RimK family alpha-L-glutamate ligase [Polyangiaceae bacterium]